MTVTNAQTITATINKPTLKLGSTGPNVVELQKLLAHWEYFFGAADGNFDSEVEYAVKGYQHRVFLTEDGCVGPKTWKAIYTGAPVGMPMLRRGSSGQAVRTLQGVLQENGYYPYEIDGIFGALTEVAVRAMQIDGGLPNDGVVGARTWHALSKLFH